MTTTDTITDTQIRQLREEATCDHPRMNGNTCTECDEICTCGGPSSAPAGEWDPGDCPIHGAA